MVISQNFCSAIPVRLLAPDVTSRSLHPSASMLNVQTPREFTSPLLDTG